MVQASQTIASYWLPRHLATFRQAYPGIDIRLRVSNTKQTAEAVLNGTAELGFVEGPVDDPLLTSVPIAREVVWSKSMLHESDIYCSENPAQDGIGLALQRVKRGERARHRKRSW